MNKIQLTQDGYDKLQIELKELQKVKRPYAVERLQKARAMGDLSENSEYTAAKENLAFVEGRILEIETMLKNTEIVQTSQNNDVSAIGSTITVESDGKTITYQLVGEFEADPLNNKLSVSSPIGQALIGKKAGDQIEVNVPSGKNTFKVKSIR